MMKKSHAISFVYFDLGGVVIDNEVAKRELSREFHLDVDVIQRFFDNNWRKACSGALDNKAYLTNFKNELGIKHPKDDFVNFITDYQGHYQETHDLIHELAREYRLGILSNAELGIVETLIKRKKIPNISWDVVIESAQFGVVKPEQAIYALAQKMAHVAAEEILFIDDRPINVDTALALGWNAVVFDYRDVQGSVKKVKKALRKRC